jgi:hypothetical protein
VSLCVRCECLRSVRMSAPSAETSKEAAECGTVAQADASSRGKRLLMAVEAALTPLGVLSDLSRIVAEYAHPLPQWAAHSPDVKKAAGMGTLHAR